MAADVEVKSLFEGGKPELVRALGLTRAEALELQRAADRSKTAVDKGLRLLDLAKKLSLSSSFISAVETGKKPIPAGYVDFVAARRVVPRRRARPWRI